MLKTIINLIMDLQIPPSKKNMYVKQIKLKSNFLQLNKLIILAYFESILLNKNFSLNLLIFVNTFIKFSSPQNKNQVILIKHLFKDANIYLSYYSSVLKQIIDIDKLNNINIQLNSWEINY